MITCAFCKEQIPEPHERQDTQSFDVFHYKCGRCTAHYFWDPGDAELKTYQFLTKHGGDVFIVEFHVKTNRFTIFANKAGAPEIVMQLDYIPDNITPDNIHKKLPTLLTFS